MKLFNSLSQLCLEKCFIIYDKKLELLKEKLAIKLYAHEILDKGIANYNMAVAGEQYANYSNYMYYGAYAMGGIIVVFLALAIMRSIIDNNALVEGAKLATQSAVLGAANNNGLMATQETVQEGFSLTKELCASLVMAASELRNEATTQGFQKVHEKMREFDEILKIILLVIDKIKAKIDLT